MEQQQFQPEQRAIWVHTYRGGYGYTHRIPVRVVKVHPNSATIAVPRVEGGSVFRVVPLRSLEAEA